jgi:glucosamine--fructose-6-phosphate aminotransferase (isomerizing)
MEAEIREQPDALTRNAKPYLDAARSYLAGRRFDMVLLAARGSSDNAALYARYLIEIHLGIPVSLAAPSVLTRYGSHVRYTNCLAIGISQSGAAPDVAEVLSYARESGHATLAVTNTDGSRLTQTAEASILLNAGPEKAVAATKTYSASLLAMAQIVRALGGQLPEPSTPLMTDEAVEAAGRRAKSDAELLLASNPVFALARGYSYASAEETAIKLMECALVPAKSYSTADFMHGPKALANSGSLLLSFGEPAPALNGEFRSIEYIDHTPEPLRPISEILHGQWLSLHAARLRGLNPDQPANLTKVTETL